MSSARLADLVASCLDIRWHLDPVEATGAGLARFDHVLGSYTGADVELGIAALKSVAEALEETDTETLDDEIDRTALLNDVRVTVHRFEREQPHKVDPAFWLNHALDGLYQLTVVRDRSAEHLARAVEGRIRALPGFLESASATLEGCPAVFVQTGTELATAGIGLVENVVRGLVPAGSPDLDSACVDAQTALRDFANRVQSMGTEAGEGDFAIGEAAFNYRLHYEHALNSTAPELWRYGNGLMDEVRRDLGALAKEIDPGRPWQEVVARLRAEHPPRDGVIAAYTAEMERAREFVEAHGLVSVPQGELNVLETPPFLRSLIPFAAYQPPGAFSENRTGWFYVTPPDPDSTEAEAEAVLRDHCVHELACTALHEGYPGHHLQFLRAQAQPRLVRKVISTPLSVEGWALYCEEMMGEAGFYRTPEERLFQRVALLWRAARIVLDVGLHTRGMAIGDAGRVLVDELGFAPSNADAEVRRYCAHPAYQLSYAVGLRELLELRESYRASVGGDYTPHGFHDAVLQFGGLPVSMMRWGLGLGG